MKTKSEKLPQDGDVNNLSATSTLADAVREQVFRSLYMGEGDLLRKTVPQFCLNDVRMLAPIES